jgi:uncharacterized membrane protein
MPTADTNPADAIGVLLTALGLSSVSGLRAYLPLLAAAIGSDVTAGTNGQLITLSPHFKDLGTPWIVAILAVLAFGEFFVDKIPVVDHLSDVVHTVIRPLSGAVIMAGINNPLSNFNPWIAAVIGAALSLTVHTVKATARPVVTATTVGHGNPVVSFLEDIAAVFVTVLAVLLPVVAIALMALLVFFVGRFTLSRIKKLRARRAARRAPALSAGGPGSNVTRGTPWQ